MLHAFGDGWGWMSPRRRWLEHALSAILVLALLGNAVVLFFAEGSRMPGAVHASLVATGLSLAVRLRVGMFPAAAEPAGPATLDRWFLLFSASVTLAALCGLAAGIGEDLGRAMPALRWTQAVLLSLTAGSVVALGLAWQRLVRTGRVAATRTVLSPRHERTLWWLEWGYLTAVGVLLAGLMITPSGTRSSFGLWLIAYFVVLMAYGTRRWMDDDLLADRTNPAWRAPQTTSRLGVAMTANALAALAAASICAIAVWRARNGWLGPLEMPAAAIAPFLGALGVALLGWAVGAVYMRRARQLAPQPRPEWLV